VPTPSRNGAPEICAAVAASIASAASLRDPSGTIDVPSGTPGRRAATAAAMDGAARPHTSVHITGANPASTTRSSNASAVPASTASAPGSANPT
jgi:hypothetical protein